MPWIRAKLRGQTVLARADAAGALAAESGRVEIRYRKDDGRMYRAMAGNLVVEDATLLPDDHCAPAEAVEAKKPDGAAAKGGAGRGNGRAGGARAAAAASREPPPTAPADGEVLAYADGACSGNPGPAGLGVVVTDGKEWVELSEYLGIGTNNIAELRAVMRALDEIGDRPASIHTDSSYTIGVAQRGWKAKANQELVAELRARLAQNRRVRLVYVPGHAGVSLNERADALARDAISHRASRRSAVPAARRLSPVR
ncbi:MAG: ribonuclease HI [Polyangiaceae bacterium]|nr:ribonuclease HI [Polyangiaceae bacterium]